MQKASPLNTKAKQAGLAARIYTHELELLWAVQQSLGGRCPFTRLPLTVATSPAHHLVHVQNGGANAITNIVFVDTQVSRHKRLLSVADFCEETGLPVDMVCESIDAIHSRLQKHLPTG